MKRLFAVVALFGLLLAVVPVVRAGIPDPGPARTNIYLQNLGAADAAVNVAFTTGESSGQLAWQTDTRLPVPPRTSRPLLYTDLAGSIADGWAGAIEASAAQPMAGIVSIFWDSSSGARTAATYEAVDSPQTQLFLPNLLVRDERQTRVTVQNTEDAAASITIQFYNRLGTLVGTKYDTILAYSEKTYPLHLYPEANFSATAGTGSARITASRKIAAVASIHAADWSGAYTGAYSGQDLLWVPGVFRRYYDGKWQNYSATIVQNVGDVTANVTIYFLNLDNSIQHTMTDTINPRAAAGYNMISQGTMDPAKFQAMIQALGDNWQGTMKFTSSQPLAGVSFYWAPSTNVYDNIAYRAGRDNEGTTNPLAFPAVSRMLRGYITDQWSTTLVQNLAASGGTLQVEFHNTAGYKVGSTYNVSIPASGSVRLNLKTGLDLPGQGLTDLGTDFAGSMYVTPVGGPRIVAVNHIFYTGEGRASGYSGFAVP